MPPGERDGPRRRRGKAARKNFWRAIVANEYEAPAGMPLNQLVPELTGLLGSTDGERRDDLALNFLETWIYKRMIAPEDVRPIVPIVLANVGRGLGSVITIPSCADPSRR